MYIAPVVYLQQQNHHKILRSLPLMKQIRFFPDATFVKICTFWTLEETPWQLSQICNFCPEFTAAHIEYHQLVRSRARGKHFLVLYKVECRKYFLYKVEAEIKRRVSSPSKSLEQELSACKSYSCRYPMGLSQTCWIHFWCDRALGSKTGCQEFLVLGLQSPSMPTSSLPFLKNVFLHENRFPVSELVYPRHSFLWIPLFQTVCEPFPSLIVLSSLS